MLLINSTPIGLNQQKRSKFLLEGRAVNEKALSEGYHRYREDRLNRRNGNLQFERSSPSWREQRGLH